MKKICGLFVLRLLMVLVVAQPAWTAAVSPISQPWTNKQKTMNTALLLAAGLAYHQRDTLVPMLKEVPKKFTSFVRWCVVGSKEGRLQDIIAFAQRYRLTLGIALLTLWIYTKYKKELAYWGHARMPKLSGFKRGNIEKAVGEGGGQLLLDRFASNDFGRTFGALDKLREDAKQLNSFGHTMLRAHVVENNALLGVLSGSRQNVDPVTEVVTPEIVTGLFRSEQVSEPIKAHLLSKCTKDELIGLMNASEGTDSFKQNVLKKLSSLVDCRQYVSWLCDRQFCEKQSDAVLKTIAFPVPQQAVVADFETLTKTLAPPLDEYKYRVLIALNQAPFRDEGRRNLLFSDAVLQAITTAARGQDPLASQLFARLLALGGQIPLALISENNFMSTLLAVARNPGVRPPAVKDSVGAIFTWQLCSGSGDTRNRIFRQISTALAGEHASEIVRLFVEHSDRSQVALITPEVIAAICRIYQPLEAFSQLNHVVQKFPTLTIADDCVKALITRHFEEAIEFLLCVNELSLRILLNDQQVQAAFVRTIEDCRRESALVITLAKRVVQSGCCQKTPEFIEAVGCCDSISAACRGEILSLCRPESLEPVLDAIPSDVLVNAICRRSADMPSYLIGGLLAGKRVDVLALLVRGERIEITPFLAAKEVPDELCEVVADRLVGAYTGTGPLYSGAISSLSLQKAIVDKICAVMDDQRAYVALQTILSSEPIVVHILKTKEPKCISVLSYFVLSHDQAKITDLFADSWVQNALCNAICDDSADMSSLVSALVKKYTTWHLFSPGHPSTEFKTTASRIFTSELIDAFFGKARYIEALSALLLDQRLVPVQQDCMRNLLVRKLGEGDRSILPIVSKIGEKGFSVRDDFFTEELINALFLATDIENEQQNCFIESALNEINPERLTSVVNITNISAAWAVYPNKVRQELVKRADLRGALLTARTKFSINEIVSLLLYSPDPSADTSVGAAIDALDAFSSQDAVIAWLAKPGNDVKKGILNEMYLRSFLGKLLRRDASTGNRIPDDAIIAVLKKYPVLFFRNSVSDVVFDGVKKRLETDQLSVEQRSMYEEWCRVSSASLLRSHK